MNDLEHMASGFSTARDEAHEGLEAYGGLSRGHPSLLYLLLLPEYLGELRSVEWNIIRVF
jgi:hypothetical protein